MVLLCLLRKSAEMVMHKHPPPWLNVSGMAPLPQIAPKAAARTEAKLEKLKLVDLPSPSLAACVGAISLTAARCILAARPHPQLGFSSWKSSSMGAALTLALA